MRTMTLGLFVAGLFAATLTAGDDGVAGNWKVIILEESQLANPWLIRVENKAGKWSGAAEGLKGMPATKLNDFKVSGDLVQFELKLPNGITFHFEGKAPRAGAKKILGSISREGNTIPAYLEATAAKNSFELDREMLTRSPNDPRVFPAVLDLIQQAKDNKVPAKEVQEWLDTVERTAEGYGPRFRLDFTMKLIEVLSAEKDYAPLSASIAAKVESLLDPKAPPATQLAMLSTLAGALKKSGTPEQLKSMESRIEKLEEAVYTEYAKTALEFNPAKFKGRQGKSDRAVLVELFTGAQCPPCVAADVAFDALEKAFPARDVVLLQYHLHVPRPDALCNADVEKRSEYYGRSLGGTPTIYLNGIADKKVQGGGGRDRAEDKFNDYRKALEPLLERPAGAQVEAKAIRKGDKIAIQASVRGLEKAGEAMRLRFALVEDWVRYKGHNGTLYHQRVVRGLPGGPAGIALTKKEGEHTAAVDLNELRAGLHKYLDDFAKNEAPFLDTQRPMRLRNLRVVAFVQNDETNEVLQAVETPVTEEQ